MRYLFQSSIIHIKRHIILCVLLLSFVNCGIDKQQAFTNIYCRAIEDYITDISSKKIWELDTLYIANRKNGQADDFPNITLPEKIKGISIKVIDPAKGKLLFEEKKSRLYINMMGWIEKDSAQFIFVTFSNGFQHIFDYNVDYVYDNDKSDFSTKSSHFEMYTK